MSLLWRLYWETDIMELDWGQVVKRTVWLNVLQSIQPVIGNHVRFMSKTVTQKCGCVLVCMRKIATRGDSRSYSMKIPALILCNIRCALFFFAFGRGTWYGMLWNIQLENQEQLYYFSPITMKGVGRKLITLERMAVEEHPCGKPGSR